MATDREVAGQLSQQALDHLLESRRQFLSFIRRRVESREAAEDILQAAFVKAIEKGGAIRKEETVVAWFYRCCEMPSSTTIGSGSLPSEEQGT